MIGLFTGRGVLAARGRFTHLVIAGIAVVALTSASASAAPIISVVPAATNVAVADVFTLEFWVGATDPSDADDVFNLYAYQFGVAFNPLVLSANSVGNGTFLTSNGDADFFIPGVIDNVSGLISFNANTLLAAPAGVSGSGSLLSVNFTALAAGTSLVSAVFDPAAGDFLLDFDFLPIAPFSVIDGSVTVGSPNQVPEPATVWLVGLGLAMGAAARRRHQRRV